MNAATRPLRATSGQPKPCSAARPPRAMEGAGLVRLWQRMCRAQQGGRFGGARAQLIRRIIHIRYGCHISPESPACRGRGQRAPPGRHRRRAHGVEIGDDATIYQGVTLGQGGRGEGYPSVGAAATLYAGAVVVGPIAIGRGAIVGANAVVLADVPDGATVVGAPARIVRPGRRSERAMKLSHGIINSSALAISSAFNFIAFAVWTYLLTPSQLGLFTLISLMVLMMNAVFFEWLRLSMARLLYNKEDPLEIDPGRANVVCAIALTIASCLLITATGLWLAEVSVMGLDPIWLFAIVAWLISEMMFSLSTTLNRLRLKSWGFFVNMVCRSALSVAAGYVLVAWGGLATTGVVLGIISAQLLCGTLSIVFDPVMRRLRPWRISGSDTRLLLGFGSPLIFSSGLTYLGRRVGSLHPRRASSAPPRWAVFRRGRPDAEDRPLRHARDQPHRLSVDRAGQHKGMCAPMHVAKCRSLCVLFGLVDE